MEVKEHHSKCEEILFQKAGGTVTQSYTVSHLSHRDKYSRSQSIYWAYRKQIPFVITVQKKNTSSDFTHMHAIITSQIEFVT